jgi:hypothetical protein
MVEIPFEHTLVKDPARSESGLADLHSTQDGSGPKSLRMTPVV